MLRGCALASAKMLHCVGCNRVVHALLSNPQVHSAQVLICAASSLCAADAMSSPRTAVATLPATAAAAPTAAAASTRLAGGAPPGVDGEPSALLLLAALLLQLLPRRRARTIRLAAGAMRPRIPAGSLQDRMDIEGPRVCRLLQACCYCKYGA